VGTESSGGAVGGHIGYSVQSGSVVAGIEVSFTSLIMDAARDTGLEGTTAFGESRIDNLVLVTGRLGWAFDRSLIYAKGGWASADVDLNFGVGTTLTGTTSGRENGWTAGLGWAHALTKDVSVAVEYNYVHLDIDDRAYTILPGNVCINPACGVRDAEADIHSVTVRLNVKAF
jgi:outer membrane immunogenic protein